MGKEVDLEKLRSVGALRGGYSSSTRKTVKGNLGGSETEHWDGRQDAHIVAQPVVRRNRKQE